MKQLTPETFKQLVCGMGMEIGLTTNELGWEDNLRDLIEELYGQEYITYGANVDDGQDYSYLTLYVHSNITGIGSVSITFNHDFTPLLENKIDWTDLCTELIHQNERAKKIKEYMATEKDQTPATTQPNA